MQKGSFLGSIIIALVVAGGVWYYHYTRPLQIDIAQLDAPPEGVWVCRGSFPQEGGFEGSIIANAYIADGYVRAEFQPTSAAGRFYGISKSGRTYAWDSARTYNFDGPSEGAFGLGGTGKMLACEKRLSLDDRLFELPPGRFYTVASWRDVGGVFQWE